MTDPIIPIIKLYGKTAEKRVRESIKAYPPEIWKAVGEKIKEKETNMTDLQARAKAYAVSILNNSDSETFSRGEMYHALAEAYEQGYIECDTEGERPETQDEYFNDAPDCRYFSDGDCAKGLPGTPCERKGCAAYYPKEKILLHFPNASETEPYVYDPNKKPDWSIDLMQCTPSQLRYLSQLGVGVGEVISNKCKAKDDDERKKKH